ncbi:LCP family protein [Streptomyces sp. B6B3]|uniref:LCP family protein n=1 Tax=Streptomyces sp. B6B3 TaxID=3153570 RepID=UPI00325DA2CD
MDSWTDDDDRRPARDDRGHGYRGGHGRDGGNGVGSRPRRLVRATAVLVVALLVASAGTYLWADTTLNRDVDLGEIGDRPPDGRGTTYLVVGSDSREGLSEEDTEELHTGAVEGRRTDSMILLHTGAHGTTMVSLPRDSWVTIPGYLDPDTGKRHSPARNKLNAAFSLGGPELLVRTIEFNTGVRIDHYAESGFGGFVDIVDSVGGVEMCLDQAVRDESSGADLERGCQTLDGADALAFVRQRHQEAQGDLGRTRNQQRFLAALAERAAAPGTLLNPLRLVPAVRAGLEMLIVDEGMSLPDLASMFQALRGVSGGDGTRINVPVADTGLRTRKGSAVRWDAERAERLFEELREDRPVTVS